MNSSNINKWFIVMAGEYCQSNTTMYGGLFLGNPATWQPYNSTATVPESFIDRGFTFHEHLYPFTLINMNGRAYDPLVGRFLSADPYIQAPDNTQNLNRYSYCLNNPLIFTDPSGEFIIEAMIIGGMVNWMMSGSEFNLKGLKSFGIGILAGAAGYGAGQFVAGIAGTVGFAAGATTGAAAGFAGGFVGGAGNAWSNNENFEQGLVKGLFGGGIGIITGGLIGGLQGGLQAKAMGLKYWSGTGNGTPVDMSASNSLPTDPGQPTGITNSNQLTENTFSNYSSSKDYVQGTFMGNERSYANPIFTSRGYYVDNGQLYNAAGEACHVATMPFKENVFGGVKSLITISPNMVTYANNLHAVLGHEVIHAFHIYTGFMSTYGSGVSEYYAHRFSASVSHVSQAGAASVANYYWIGLPLNHHVVYPSWVSKIYY